MIEEIRKFAGMQEEKYLGIGIIRKWQNEAFE